MNLGPTTPATCTKLAKVSLISTGMTVTGTTKDVICTTVAPTEASQRSQRSLNISLTMKITMAKRDQVSQLGSSATRIHSTTIMDVASQKHRDLPTTSAIGMAPAVRMSFGTTATGKNRTAPGWRVKTKTGSEATRTDMKEATGMPYSTTQNRPGTRTLTSSTYKCSSVALKTG